VAITYLEFISFFKGENAIENTEDDDVVEDEDAEEVEVTEEVEVEVEVDTNIKLLSLAFACSAVLFVSSFIFNILHIYKCVGLDEDKNQRTMRERRRKRNYPSEGFISRRPIRSGRGSKYWNYEDEKLHYTPKMEIVPKWNKSLNYSRNAIHPRVKDFGWSSQRTGDEIVIISNRGVREKNGVIEITAGEPGELHPGSNLRG